MKGISHEDFVKQIPQPNTTSDIYMYQMIVKLDDLQITLNKLMSLMFPQVMENEVVDMALKAEEDVMDGQMKLAEIAPTRKSRKKKGDA